MLAEHLTAKLSDLNPNPHDKFAIAFSGGGDSTALVHALKDHPQRGPVYIVDHALRKGSGEEAKAAKTFAQSCGFEAHILTWKNRSPKSAIQEKARRARYGLMGQACRIIGIKVLLTAHSRDDQAETLLMRYDRNTDWRGAAGMPALSYAPVWPELAGVNIGRPLLDISRQELRNYNRSYGLSWAEDPSNQNRDYARIRARDYLAVHAELKEDLITTAKDISFGLTEEREKLRNLLKKVHMRDGGEVAFSSLPPLELLAQTLRCVGGGGQPIDRRRLGLMYQKFKMSDLKAFTFLGAQAVRDKDTLILSRDPVAVTGRSDRNISPHAVSMPLTAVPQIWDGRFILSSREAAHDIRANYGLKIQRSKTLTRYLAALHKSVRPTLPVIVHKNMAYAAHELPAIEFKSLVKLRLEAAFGQKYL